MSGRTNRFVIIKNATRQSVYYMDIGCCSFPLNIHVIVHLKGGNHTLPKNSTQWPPFFHAIHSLQLYSAWIPISISSQNLKEKKMLKTFLKRKGKKEKCLITRSGHTKKLKISWQNEDILDIWLSLIKQGILWVQGNLQSSLLGCHEKFCLQLLFYFMKI